MNTGKFIIPDYIEQSIIAKSFFSYDLSNNLYLAHDFINLGTDLRASKNKMHREFNFISQDIWNIGAILSRLEWTQSMMRKGDINDGQWTYFAALDIDHFHIELKSTMDHAAEIIRMNSEQPGIIPQNSFRQLDNWMKKRPMNKEKLGLDIVKIIESCSWLPDYRDIRDSLVHKGGHTLVFTDPDKILFQTYGSEFDNTIKAIGLMYNENIVDFKKYAALAISRLLVTLAELAKIVRIKTSVKRFGIGDNKMYGYGFSTFLQWNEELLNSSAQHSTK